MRLLIIQCVKNKSTFSIIILLYDKYNEGKYNGNEKEEKLNHEIISIQINFKVIKK